MKARITAFLTLVVLLVLPLQVQALSLSYEGQKDFWTGLDVFVFEDGVTGERIYESDLNFGQSLGVGFSGFDQQGYIQGYVTDHPKLMEETYLDMVLGNYTLQWDDYERALPVPTWFNLEQKFTGLRLGYLDQANGLNLVGARGENYLREEEILLNPGDELAGISLAYYPLVVDSVEVWLDDKYLIYGEDFYVDYTRGILFLQVPLVKPGQLRIRYLQEGEGYLVYGGHYAHHFGQGLDGGLIYLQAQGEEMQGSLLGTQWYLQPAPWWNIELDAGVILPKQAVNWHLAQHFIWPQLALQMDYQEINDNFYHLMSQDRPGKKLQVSGRYDGEKLYLRHQQNYSWDLVGELIQWDGELELMQLNRHWIPYLYYSKNQRYGLENEQGVMELRYQRELEQFPGTLVYLMGVEMNNSSATTRIDIEPYLGTRYQNPAGTLGLRLYGQEGLRFSQLVVDGNWNRGLLDWQGQIQYLPAYYHIEQGLTWRGEPAIISLNLNQTTFLQERDQQYLNLDLNLDWSQWLEKEARLWVNLLQEERDGQLTRTLLVGGEEAAEGQSVLYGEFGISDAETSYKLGLRGNENLLEYDFNYTLTNTFGELGRVESNKLAFSLGMMDYWNLSGDLELNNLNQWWSHWTVHYPLLPALDLGLKYSGEKTYWQEHQLTLSTQYHF